MVDQTNNGISEDAEAIVDRLKKEGLRTRNDGTNSIRSVKIELTKFEGIFKTISSTLQEQTELTRQNLMIARSKSMQDYDFDIKRERMFSEQLALDSQAAEESAEAARRAKNEEELSRPLVENNPDDAVPLSDRLVNVAQETGGFLLSFAKFAAGLFIGYNFVKGIVDELYGGVFSEYEGKIKSSIETFSGIMSDPLTWLVGGTAAVMGIRAAFNGIAALLGGIGTAVATQLGMKVSPGGKVEGKRLKLGPLRLAGAGLAVTMVSMGMDSVEKYLKDKGVPTEAEIKGIKINYTDAAGKVIQGATFGAFLGGPMGALIGGLAGLALSGVDILTQYINKKAEERKQKIQDELNKADQEFQEATRIMKDSESDQERFEAQKKGLESLKLQKERLEKDITETQKEIDEARKSKPKYTNAGPNARRAIEMGVDFVDPKLQEKIDALSKVTDKIEKRERELESSEFAPSPEFIKKQIIENLNKRADEYYEMLFNPTKFTPLPMNENKSLMKYMGVDVLKDGATNNSTNVTVVNAPVDAQNHSRIDNSQSNASSLSIIEGMSTNGMNPWLVN